MNPSQIYVLIVIIAVILIIIFGSKLISLCFHDTECLTLGKTNFSYPVESQYIYLRTLVFRFKDDPHKLRNVYNQAINNLMWNKEKPNKPVCSEKYYRITIPGKDTHGSDFGTLYKRKD